MRKVLIRLITIMSNIIEKLRVYSAKKSEFKKIKDRRRVKIEKTVELSSEQKKQIDLFYKSNYGRRIKYYWHKEYYAISGKFDYKYFPEFLYIPEFERLENSPEYFNAFGDKNIIEILSYRSGVCKSPKCYVRCSNGILLNENYKQISLDDAKYILSSTKEELVFVKPAKNSMSGNGCFLIDPKKINFDKLMKAVGKDFIIQERIINSPELKALNPTSVNTFRVITYILDGKVYNMPAILRIGRNGKYLDNAHQGGMFIGVNSSGSLLPMAVTEFGERFVKHPDTKIVFDGYYIKGFEKVVSAAKALQAMMPHVGCINWDLTLDEKMEVVLIEGNMRFGSIWLIQMAHGKGCFEENTARVLQTITKKRKLY